MGINMTNYGLVGGVMASLIAGIAGGLAIVIENPWRRLEVAQFVLQKGMVSAWERFYKNRLPETTLQRLYFVLFTGSTSYLVHAYTNYPHNVCVCIERFLVLWWVLKKKQVIAQS